MFVSNITNSIPFFNLHLQNKNNNGIISDIAELLITQYDQESETIGKKCDKCQKLDDHIQCIKEWTEDFSDILIVGISRVSFDEKNKVQKYSNDLIIYHAHLNLENIFKKTSKKKKGKKYSVNKLN